MIYYCPNCQQHIHPTKVCERRIYPEVPPPWALFEVEIMPMCPLCDGDLNAIPDRRIVEAEANAALEDLRESTSRILDYIQGDVEDAQ